jgi:hypothetical protein
MTDETGWRPIETAPDDGRQALVALSGGAICIAPLSGLAEASRARRVQLAKDGIWPDFAEFRATHWRPLPPPPTPKEKA